MALHPIALRAIEGNEPIAELVEAFYGQDGPLVAAGMDVRPQQRQMSREIALMLDTRVSAGDVSSVVIEAPCGTGKSLAYLVPGALQALRLERRWWDAKREEARRRESADTRRMEPNAKDHPPKFAVSTAGIALQGQIVLKDIPALAEMLGVEIRASLLKGIGNYVCKRALNESMGDMFRGAGNEPLQRLYDWTQRPSCSGDREALDWDPSVVWGLASTSSDLCARQGCVHFEKGCFWRQAVRGWPSAHIVVMNHHYAAMKPRIFTFGWAVDEAHEVERALRGALGMTLRLSPPAKRMISTMEKLGILSMDLEPAHAALFGVLRDRVESRLQEMEREGQRSPQLRLEGDWLGEDRPQLMDAWRAYAQLCADAYKAALTSSGILADENRPGRLVLARNRSCSEEERSELTRIVQTVNRVVAMAICASAAIAGKPHFRWVAPDKPWAMWASREMARKGEEKPAVVIEFQPADVSTQFRHLAVNHRRVILTSATCPEDRAFRLTLGMEGQDVAGERRWPAKLVLAGAGYAFTPIRGEDAVGASDDLDEQPDGDEEKVERSDELTYVEEMAPPAILPRPRVQTRLSSPYDLDRLGLLVVPSGSSPKDSNWSTWAVEQVVDVVQQAGGRSLILATTTAQMKRYAEALASQTSYPVKMQGQEGKSRLIAWFRDQTDGVLVGTRSLFQGVDVKGESCSVVLIDKIPFGSPDDPVEDAVGRLLVQRAGGGDSWDLRSVPEAAMALAQGAGRLIRSATDRGVVVLLDSRILQAGPGWAALRRALPPFSLATSASVVGPFLAGERVPSRTGMIGPPRLQRAGL